MVTFFLVVLGGLMGAAADEANGAFIGMIIGYLAARLIVDHQRRKKLDERLKALELQVALLQGGSRVSAAQAPIVTPVPVTPAAIRAASEDDLPASERKTVELGAPEHLVAESRSPTAESREPVAPLFPAAPSGPDPIERLRALIFGGNTVVRVGVIILLFGVGFLVKYGAEHGMFPIELRLIGAVILGMGLLIVGFRLRNKRLAYAVSLQGGGIGTIYLVTFAALKIYELIPHGAALAVFVVLAVATAFLAIVQDALALAVLGVLGGFLAPILASNNSGNFVALFTYYAILNAAILVISWFKDWRVLNLLGFTCTFLVGTAWGLSAYQPENYAWTQFFLALFFVFYATIAVFYAVKRPAKSRGIIDGTLVFGLPAIAFALQVGLVKDTPWGLAVSAVVVAGFYIGVASIVWKKSPEHGRSLAEAFTALGVVFVTMAIPFALNASWTAAAYALEGAGLVWVGRRQKKPLAEAAGVLLQFAAGVTFDSPGSAELSQPVIDAIYPYAFLRAVGALASAYFLRTRVSAISSVAQGLLVVWAIAWLTGGTIYDIFDHDENKHFAVITLGAITVHALLLDLIGKRLAWTAGRLGALLLGAQLAVGVVIWAILELGFEEQQDWSWAGWLFALAVWMLLLKRQDKETYPKTLAVAYGVTPLLVSTALAGIAYLHIDRHVPEGVWSAVAAALIPAFVLFAFLAADLRDRWPMVTHRAAVINGFVPVVVYLLFWSLGGSFGSDGDPSPLPYVPLLTPLDLTQAFIILAGVAWALRVRVRYPERFEALRVPFIAVLCFVLFAHLSAVCVRSCHYYAGVPWDWDDLMDSTVVQTSLSIAWTVIALVVTALASRKKWRVVWMVGGALLGVVVLKLFIVDLSHIQTVARIISFLVVGLLLLLIGWISPVPPRLARA
ncbi:MAG: DUF2339 domain-containing protein [Myxococcota bacterium]